MSDFITVAELRIEAERLCDENERLEAENAELRNDADLLRAMLSQERLEKQCYMAENAKLRELATYALRYIERERCDDPKYELWHGKPCESCAEAGSSDCPKIMAKMFGELGIEAEQ